MATTLRDHELWLARKGKDALRMAEAFSSTRHMRIIWQERAADYRETLVNSMRARQGWTLAERIAGKRALIPSTSTYSGRSTL